MIFNKEEKEWEEVNAIYTAKEIYQQPKMWEKTFTLIQKEKETLKMFLNFTLKQEDFDIILCGAGSSEYIGNSVFSYVGKKLNHKVKSYSSCEIVSSPMHYLSKEKATLLIHFARSGNSPESLGAVKIADKVCKNVRHLFITCNAQGNLSMYGKERENIYVLNLPEETHDLSFAMTSSFSSMLLAVLLVFHLEELDAMYLKLKDVMKCSEKFLSTSYSRIETLVNTYDFKRIVYLGSNTSKGIAQESALKMCELCAGKMDTIFDTPMGFRHGPKSVIHEKTLLVFYMSDEVYTRQYEIDVVKEVWQERKGNKILVVSSREDELLKNISDYSIFFENQNSMENSWLGLEYILVGQLLALYKSIKEKNTPDHPCINGEVNRVVKGVKIYPLNEKENI